MGSIVVDVTLVPLTEQEHALLNGLRQCLLYDLSLIYKFDPNDLGLFDASGFYPSPDPAQDRVWLIRADAAPAGYVSVRRGSRIDPAFGGHTFGELFVLRRWRNQGIGRAVAEQVLRWFPGPWELAESAVNVPGHTFYRALADRFTDGNYQEAWRQHDAWRGPVQRFTVS